MGGLAPDVGGDELRARFAQFGRVGSVDVICDPDASPATTTTAATTCRGFAYVDLEISDEALQKCIKVYSGSKWRGRQLTVQLAEPHYLKRLEEERAAMAEEQKAQLVAHAQRAERGNYATSCSCLVEGLCCVMARRLRL